MDIKTCTQCGEERVLDDYRPTRGQCKPCERAYKRRYHKDHMQQERIYRSRYYLKNKERLNKDRVDYARVNTERQKEVSAKSQRKYKEKCNARNRLRHAVKREKVEKEGCVYIGGKCRGRIEGHHWDYTKALDVTWFCQKHHALADRVKKLLDNQKQYGRCN